MVHLTSRWWHNNKNDDIIFSLQIFIHMTSLIDDKMMWMFKISFENVIKIKIISNITKNNYANDVDKMICHYIDNVVIQLFTMFFKWLSVI